MLAERASADYFWIVTSRRMRTCFSLGFLTLFLFSWALRPAAAVSGGRDNTSPMNCPAMIGTQASSADPGSPGHEILTSPVDETSELYPPSPLRFETDSSTIILWQASETTSSRITPQGLVLSFLCDSARHQCSGVLLA